MAVAAHVLESTPPERPERHGRPGRPGPRPALRLVEAGPGLGGSGGRVTAAVSTPRAVYRRRRLGALALLVVLSAGAGAAVPLRSEAAPAHQPEPATVVVSPGDTVLGLVFPHVPAGEDARHYAAEVAAHNGLDARDLRPGTVLELPRR